MRIFIDPQGNLHEQLPNPWNNITPFTERNCTRHGWRIQDDFPPFVCTRLQLLETLAAEFEELYEALVQAYRSDADIQLFWNSSNDLDRRNNRFKQLVEKLGIDEDTVKAVFLATERHPTLD